MSKHGDAARAARDGAARLAQMSRPVPDEVFRIIRREMERDARQRTATVLADAIWSAATRGTWPDDPDTLCDH